MTTGDVALAGVALLLLVRWVRRRERRRIRAAWRELLIRLGIRRITPRRGERLPARLAAVEPAGDTGGGYRPKHRPQDPAKDPHEPYNGESSSVGNDHGWSGCTMSAAADALAYATGGRLTPWGGDMRHRQGDLSGGTDLYDARDAFRAYGEELTIRSGSGWSRVVSDHEDGRAIVIQGSGEVPGSGSFDGGHACAIGTETHSDGRWLFGDPLASDWQWIKPSAIRSWAERWQSSIAYAVTALPPAPEPEPEEEPARDATPYDAADVARSATVALRPARELAAAELEDALAGEWIAWLRAPAPGPADRWDVGAWHELADVLAAYLEDGDPDPCAPEELAPATWTRPRRAPFPASAALEALELPATWDRSGWPGAVWP